tara:strand:- start:321 stop:707 length:387 start_codon:yes stop_codon:yes gene_type:complete
MKKNLLILSLLVSVLMVSAVNAGGCSGYINIDDVDQDEQCDDGNNDNFDGCDENCELEEIICYEHTDRGTNECAGGPNYCFEGNVYQHFNIYTCVNPGTYESTCQEAIAPWLLQICDFECNNGACINP